MILKKDQLDALLTELSRESIVYVPKVVSGVSKFAPFISDEAADLAMPNTFLPPKDLLFPQSQNLYHYGVDAAGDMFVDPIIESAPQVIFGLRPCDVRSIECLDDVFLTKVFVDDHYKAKRDATLLVALCCTEPHETCFCDSMGIDPNAAPVADIVLHERADAYNVEAQSEKGREALAAWEPFCEEGSFEVEPVVCSLKLDTENLAERAAQVVDDPEIWDSLSTKCLTCGTCTFVCPSCYCFDISQENRCKEGVRFRCWDSCMFSDYSEMAGGHNPRADKVDRVRNRFMHKLCYFDQRYGKELCVGCGRCVRDCPVGVDITRIIDQIGELTHA